MLTDDQWLLESNIHTPRVGGLRHRTYTLRDGINKHKELIVDSSGPSHTFATNDDRFPMEQSVAHSKSKVPQTSVGSYMDDVSITNAAKVA